VFGDLGKSDGGPLASDRAQHTEPFGSVADRVYVGLTHPAMEEVDQHAVFTSDSESAVAGAGQLHADLYRCRQDRMEVGLAGDSRSPLDEAAEAV